jgi:hypothetical protein
VVLLLGGTGDQTRVVAKDYGFNNVIAPSDILRRERATFAKLVQFIEILNQKWDIKTVSPIYRHRHQEIKMLYQSSIQSIYTTSTLS